MGQLSDLRRWRDQRPHAIAIHAYRASGEAELITYAELARRVTRFAGALYELGVRPGRVIAYQLPNCWQAHVLLIAAARLQAVVAPIMTTIRPRELQRVLHRVGASVFVTTAECAGFRHGAALKDMASTLPELRHRVVIGEPTEGDLDFRSFVEQTPWEQGHPVALDDAVEDPDRVATILFTSGTSGEPKGALHTENTLYASARSLTEVHDFGPDDVRFTPHALMHTVGQDTARSALMAGASVVLLDEWSGQRGLQVLADSGTTGMVAAPSFVYDMLAAARRKPTPLPTLRTVRCVGTTIPKPLITAVPATFGARLLSGWGTTEIGTGTVTRVDDPPNWAAFSDGRPVTGVEVELRSPAGASHEQPGRVFVRGGTVCLATVCRDTGALTVTAEHDDGWYDTGDLAVPDGCGGIRLMGRVADRIGGVLMIPARDVESELLRNPRIQDVALVGYRNRDGGESPCAVMVPATTPPIGLDEVRHYLTVQGMTEWYLPTRLEYVEALPRNGNGKVRKELLRRWLVGHASLCE
ncbi:AMP-binding protein [Mycobacterium sp. NPDC048908]|uniref:AMP-binding protein n=1 Tax=Mycobacterium sp. NPDC048908 TaxID=3364292 RepID=UPI00370FA717